MNEPENYFRLHTDFFESRAIKKIRKSAGGDTYAICYLRMLTLASMNNGRICSEGIGDMSEEIALELNERKENVSATLFFLETYGLIERIGNTEIIFPQCTVNPNGECEREWRDNSM